MKAIFYLNTRNLIILHYTCLKSRMWGLNENPAPEDLNMV